MAILRNEFPATPHWRAADLRAELSRLDTVVRRTDRNRSSAIQALLVPLVEELTSTVGTSGSTAATLVGVAVDEATAVAALDTVSDGSLDITVDGTVYNLTGMNFTGVTTLAAIAAVIDAALTSATVTATTTQVTFTSNTTGTTSTISETSDPAVGTYVGTTIGVDTAQAGTVTQGTGFPPAHAGIQVDIYPELRDFLRKYKLAKDFATASSASVTILDEIAAQVQYALEQYGWTFA